MIKKHTIFLILLLILISSCMFFESKPTAVDGSLSIRLRFTIPSDEDSSVTIPMENLQVKLTTDDYNIPPIFADTDSNGFVTFDQLPYAYYKAQAHSIFWADAYTQVEVVGAKVLELIADSLGNETLYTDTLVMVQSKRGLKINEVYSAGPEASMRYWDDLYIELYNGLTETIYLDGMVFLRLGTTPLFADTLHVTYIYQFPGQAVTGREYPVDPGAFVVLAGKAFDHNLIGPLDGHTVDLSEADWEFLNMIEVGAYDNPNVPNITTNNGRVTQSSKVGFLTGMTGDGYALCNGLDYDQSDGIDISTVIDCIETSGNPAHTKEVPYSVDASFGGLGLVKFSGQSVERIRPGFDTNNSRVDFEVINKPTPGYQHE